MVGWGRGSIEANYVQRDELRGLVQGYALALVDKVVGNIGGVTIARIRGGTAGVVVMNVSEGQFTEDAAVWYRR